jgi:hypothetical protein
MDAPIKAGLCVAGIIVAAGVGYLAGRGMARNDFNRLMADPDRLVRVGAESINRKSPYQIDRETRLDNAVAMGNTLQIFYTVSGVNFSMLDMGELRRQMLPQLRNRLCTSPEAAFVLSKGVGVKLVFRDSSGRQVMDFPLKAKDCRGVI